MLKTFYSFVLPFLVLFALCQTSTLQAGGWGRTEDVYTLGEETWNGIYFDMNGMHFTAAVPNYTGTVLENGIVKMWGIIDKGDGDSGEYLIMTSFNPEFTPPKTSIEFVKMVKDANKDFIVTAVNAKELGAKFAVDLVPKNSDDMIYWRFLCTKDRLIQMGTTDVKAERRLFFFESIYIY